MMRTLLAAGLLACVAVAASGATITVTGTGDGIAADGACTLREAITAANTDAAVNECTAGDAGLDTIAFNIGGGGAQTINVSASLPIITEAVSIDGNTQPGFAGAPLISVTGLPSITGFTLAATQPSTIRWLSIGNFQSAITVQSATNTVTRNYIGVDATGTAATPNGIGIQVLSPDAATHADFNSIDANVISGNTQWGVLIADALAGGSANNTTLTESIIGLNAAQTAVIPNGTGVELQNVSTTWLSDNIIAGNTGTGLVLRNATLTGIYGNTIGRSGAGNGGNGVFIDALSRFNDVSGTFGPPFNNTISANGAQGVLILGQDNSVTGNRISNNGSGATALGIDLFPIGPTANDECDVDTGGGNGLQNFPLLRSVITGQGRTRVVVTLNSTPSSTFDINVFTNPGGSLQGEVPLFRETLYTGSTCDSSPLANILHQTVPVGTILTATASNGRNTSEMSPGVAARGALSVTKQFSPAAVLRNQPSTLTISIANPNSTAETNVSFSDALPANLAIAANPAASNSCGGTLTANGGSHALSLSGGTIAANSTCTVSADVISNVAGNYTNTFGAGGVTSDLSMNLVTVSASLAVTELAAPTVTKSFDPANTTSGMTQLMITLTNSSTTAISGVQFTDQYPAGLQNAAAPGTTCGGTVTAPFGGSTLALSGGTIPGSGSCTVTVAVRSPNGGSFTNTLPAGSVTSANAAPSAAAASATVSIAATIPTASEWALMLMLLALGAIAAMRLR